MAYYSKKKKKKEWVKSSNITEKLLYIQNFKLFEKEMASLKYLHKFWFP